eukprot:scaffold106887_cov24-Phaeocystis_antarctica.AAC.1
MGTKPAKVAHRPSWPTKAAKLGRFPETEDLFAKRSSRSAGGPRTKVATHRHILRGGWTLTTSCT